MDCRPACAACCIVPAISSAIPGLPAGKPAGMACVQLDANLRCRLFGRPGRPAVCRSLQPAAEICGSRRDEALLRWAELDRQTTPERPMRATGPSGRSLPRRAP